MVTLDPISPFLALIDRLISLTKERQTRRRQYFEKIIDPLYTQFIPLGEDYLKLFRSARDAVNGPKNKRTSTLAEIADKRAEFAAARVRLRALVERCEKEFNKKRDKKRDEELVVFVTAMLRFFAPMVMTSPFSSLGRELVDFFVLWTYGPETARSAGDAKAVENLLLGASESHPSPVSTEELTQYIGGATARLETAWYEIAGRYMELKLKYYRD